jgi:Phage integrase family
MSPSGERLIRVLISDTHLRGSGALRRPWRRTPSSATRSSRTCSPRGSARATGPCCWSCLAPDRGCPRCLTSTSATSSAARRTTSRFSTARAATPAPFPSAPRSWRRCGPSRGDAAGTPQCSAPPEDRRAGWAFPASAERLATLAEDACISRPVTPHMLRHTYAVRALLHGNGNVMAISKLLGHRQLSTTQRYLDHLELPDLLASVPALPGARL